ncbi:MAG: tRNA(His) guanylyltransferase [Aureobasidium pullulans]|nr:MAG: tRNA(His) guanylyltransferase [Aureobasidium pullulans]
MSGPPSRVMTPASGPPSGPPSMAASPAAPQTGFPSASAPPPLGGLGGPPGSAPPSRPATSMSNASSIDDLLGAPGPRKGGTAKSKKRGGRYVDVMAKP